MDLSLVIAPHSHLSQCSLITPVFNHQMPAPQSAQSAVAIALKGSAKVHHFSTSITSKVSSACSSHAALFKPALQPWHACLQQHSKGQWQFITVAGTCITSKLHALSWQALKGWQFTARLHITSAWAGSATTQFSLSSILTQSVVIRYMSLQSVISSSSVHQSSSPIADYYTLFWQAVDIIMFLNSLINGSIL